MAVRQLIRPDIMVSAIAHLSVLALIFVFAEVRRFNEVTTAPIAVDLVAPEEIENKQQAEPTPPPQLPSEAISSAETTAPPQPTPSPQAAAAAPPKAAAPADRREAAIEQKHESQAPPPPAPSPPAPSASYTPPEPDLTVKYHVMLGLPEDIPLQAAGANSSSPDMPGDGIDATASSEADLSSTIIAEFRRHLKTCSRLPAELARSDKIIIKLRVVMTPQGRLARDPILIEASASAKGPLLMQGAIAALKACQPYGMLPADRYGEWKVIDLSFTPGDFTS